MKWVSRFELGLRRGYVKLVLRTSRELLSHIAIDTVIRHSLAKAMLLHHLFLVRCLCFGNTYELFEQYVR
jgi:hypothetical protein